MPFIAFYRIFGFSVDQGTGALTQLWAIKPPGQSNVGPVAVFNIPNLIPVQSNPNGGGQGPPWSLNSQTDPIFEDIFQLLNSITTAQTGVEGVADAFSSMGELRTQYPIQLMVGKAFVGVKDTLNFIAGVGSSVSAVDGGATLDVTISSSTQRDRFAPVAGTTVLTLSHKVTSIGTELVLTTVSPGWIDPSGGYTIANVGGVGQVTLTTPSVNGQVFLVLYS